MKNSVEKVCEEVKNFVRLECVDDLVNYVEGEPVFLRALLAEGKKSTPSIMAEKMNVSKGRITALIIKLSQKGYVEAKQNSEDKRRSEVYLTEAGEKYIVDLKAQTEAKINLLFDKLGKGKVTKLYDLMNLAVDKLNK